MSIANPKPESFDKDAPSLVDESNLDDVDNVNNVGDVVASVIGKIEPAEEDIQDKEQKEKKSKVTATEWGSATPVTLESIIDEYGSFEIFAKKILDEKGIEVRLFGEEIRAKKKTLKQMGSVFIDKCREDVKPIVIKFQEALLDTDVVASVQFAKDIFTGNQNLYNGLGIAYKLGNEIKQLDIYHQEVFFQELMNKTKTQVKYSNSIKEDPYMGVVNVLYFDCDPTIKSRYKSILNYAKSQNINEDLFPDWLGTTQFEWLDNDGKRCVGTGYTSCLKEMAFSRKNQTTTQKPVKVTKEIPAWCFGKTNASISIEIPEYWDVVKQKEGMVLFRIEDDKLRLYNITTDKPHQVVKIVRENYGAADDTEYDGTESETTQFMFAVKKIIQIAKPTALMIAQRQGLYENDGVQFTAPANYYVVPLYGCYQDDVEPVRKLKDGEDASTSPLVIIQRSKEGDIPDFPTYSAYYTPERMASDDYVEERGILQCAYYTTDIKALQNWDETIHPEIRWQGTSNGQFWFMGAYFRHMDHTTDFMPHPFIHSKPDTARAAKLGHRLRFESGATAMDKYFAETKKAVKEYKGLFERHTRWTHIIVENGELFFWWPSADGKGELAQEKKIRFGMTVMKEVKAVWCVRTDALKHLFKIGGEWRILITEKQYSTLKEQYSKPENWPDDIWKRPLASYFRVPFTCQRKNLFVVINGRIDRRDM